MEKSKKLTINEQKLDLGQKRRDYFEKLIKGDSERIEKRKKQIYDGKILDSEKIEQKQLPTKKINVDAYKEAYRNWLINPKGPKPQLKDFPK